MISLAIYVISFVVILGVMGSISIFLRKNTNEIDAKAGIASEYNKFNLYMLEFTKNGYDVEIKNIEANVNTNEKASVQVIFTKKDDNYNKVTFEYKKDTKYLNFDDVLNDCEFKLCKDVNEFKAEEQEADNGKKVLKTYIDINGTVYTTDYVIE